MHFSQKSSITGVWLGPKYTSGWANLYLSDKVLLCNLSSGKHSPLMVLITWFYFQKHGSLSKNMENHAFLSQLFCLYRLENTKTQGSIVFTIRLALFINCFYKFQDLFHRNHEDVSSFDQIWSPMCESLGFFNKDETQWTLKIN